MAKLRRKESLVLYWENGQLICEDYLAKERFALTPEAVACLDAVGNSNGGSPDKRTLASLEKQGLIIRKPSALENALQKWRWGTAARYFFLRSKGVHKHVSTDKRLAHARALLDGQRQPGLYKEYRSTRRTALPEVKAFGSTASATLARLRNVRDFKKRRMSADALSEILQLSTGEQGKMDSSLWGKLLVKTHYSAGYRYPIEVYPIVVSVDGVKSGLYHYNVRRHALELLKAGDFSREARRIAGGQSWVKNASVYFLLTAVLDRTSFKYRQDAFLRSVFFDAGHVGQSVYFAAAGRNLGACATHSLRHDLADAFLGIDGITESLLYLVCVG